MTAPAVPAPPLPPTATPEQLAKVRKVAKDFETSFLEVTLSQMFKDVSAGGFGGGQGEDMVKSFLTDAFARSISDRGGVGLSRQLTHELLKMQGLSEGAPA